MPTARNSRPNWKAAWQQSDLVRAVCGLPAPKAAGLVADNCGYPDRNSFSRSSPLRELDFVQNINEQEARFPQESGFLSFTIAKIHST
jgi:hypothetical protein